MKIPSTITKSLAKMEAKLSNTAHLDPETRSTISSSDLLPYGTMRQEPTALVVAKMITRTLLIITAIVSVLVLTTVYIQSKSAKCSYGLRSGPSPQFEPLTAESGALGSDPRRAMPLSIRMSGRAGDMMNDGKGNVNCIIERKTANQIIASEPKKLVTPYGNITTDPRLIHLTGEKMIFHCHSGDDKDDEEGGSLGERPEKEKDVIIITNSKEVLPRPEVEDKTETPPEGTKETERSINSIETKTREKRSAVPKKECSCNCAC